MEEHDYILYNNGTLEMHTAQAHHSGKYTCVARNSLGIYENHVYLEVKGEQFTVTGDRLECRVYDKIKQQ